MLCRVVQNRLNLVQQNHQNINRKPGELLQESGKSFINYTTRDFAALILRDKIIDRSWKDKWKGLIGNSFPDYVPNIRSIYIYPSNFVEADVSLKLLYHALPHLNQLRHFNNSNLPTCGYCGGEGTLSHRYLACSALKFLKCKLVNICKLINPDFQLYSVPFVTGPRITFSDNRVISMVLSLAKYTINNFHTHEMYTNTQQPAGKLSRIFVSSLKSRIRTSYVGLQRHEFTKLYGSLVNLNSCLTYKFWKCTNT